MACDHLGIGDMTSVRFLFDGEAVGDDDTFQSLDMEDEDSIDILNRQTGGC